MKIIIFVICTLLSIFVNLTIQKNSNRIFQGYLAEIGQFPMYVYLNILRNENWFSCGGALLNNCWVLTAAHCVYNSTSVNLYFGSIRRSQGLKMTSSVVMIHTKYDYTTLFRDIALVKLPKKIQYTENIQPVELGLDFMSYPKILNWRCQFAGMGQSSTDEAPSNELRYTFMNILPRSNCEEYCEINEQICSHTTNTGMKQNICGGDSGSGLLYEYRRKFYVIGVVSTSPKENCTEVDAYGVFESVVPSRKWILENIKKC